MIAMRFSVKNHLKRSPEQKNAPSLSLCAPLNGFQWNWPPPHTKIKRNYKKRQKRCLLALRSVWGELQLAVPSVWGELSMRFARRLNVFGGAWKQAHAHPPTPGDCWGAKESRSGHQNECWFPNMAIELASWVLIPNHGHRNHILNPELDTKMSADSQIWQWKSHHECNIWHQHECWFLGMAIDITSWVQN